MRRMDRGEIDLLDRENALLELGEIVSRVQRMADVSYAMSVADVRECLDLWAAGGNAQAKDLLPSFRSAAARAAPLLRGLSKGGGSSRRVDENAVLEN